MTIGLSWTDDLYRVQIAISDFPNGTARIDRSANEVLWQTVRGGAALPIVSGAGSLDDYEYFAAADGSIDTFYRVSSTSLEDTVDVFTASGTWNKPSGLVAARVTVIGGGGGGGGAPATGAGEGRAAAGGGGGALAIAVIPAADLGSSETVTVASGGSGGAAGDNGGSSGGTSTFTRTTGTDLTAGGGGGGGSGSTTSSPATTSRGSGSSTTTGADVAIPGSDGLQGSNNADTFPPHFGFGGDSALGHGAKGSGNVSGADGNDGGDYGGGGSGAWNTDSQSARPGGDGAPGIVIVEHFFAGEGP